MNYDPYEALKQKIAQVSKEEFRDKVQQFVMMRMGPGQSDRAFSVLLAYKDAVGTAEEAKAFENVQMAMGDYLAFFAEWFQD